MIILNKKCEPLDKLLVPEVQEKLLSLGFKDTDTIQVNL